MKKEIKKIGVAVLGCGLRSEGVVGRLLQASERKVKVVSVFDPDASEAERTLGIWQSLDARRCKSYKEAIAAPGVDWVMVFSPNAFHCEQVTAAFKAGKHVFSEKPLATTVKDCRTIYDAYLKSGRTFATGFVLRYSELYRKAKELLDSGRMGKLLSINADENLSPHHGSYIMRNWRRKTSLAGPHILEKCCHDLDLINWYCGSLPTKVAAFGGLDFFVPENEKLIRKYGQKCFNMWRDPHETRESAFMADKDLMDTQVCIALYRNGVKVSFQATMSNACPERRMYFTCTEGNILLELYQSVVSYQFLGDREVHTIRYGEDGHGGGDAHIMKELYEVMIHGGEPKCSGSEGLESAVFALSLDEAMRKNTVVDLENIWKKLGR